MLTLNVVTILYTGLIFEHDYRAIFGMRILNVVIAVTVEFSGLKLAQKLWHTQRNMSQYHE